MKQEAKLQNWIPITKYFVSVLDAYRGGRTNHLVGDDITSLS